MNNPTIIIDLAPHLQDFLRHEFRQSGEAHGAALMVDGKHEIGKMIQAMITVSDRPRKQELKYDPFELALPIQEWNHAIFAENFIYIPEWKQVQLRMFIEACFRLRVKEYFFRGYSKGFRQENITLAFLDHYNIKNNAVNYATIKKYDYRSRRNLNKEIDRELAEY